MRRESQVLSTKITLKGDNDQKMKDNQYYKTQKTNHKMANVSSVLVTAQNINRLNPSERGRNG